MPGSIQQLCNVSYSLSYTHKHVVANEWFRLLKETLSKVLAQVGLIRISKTVT